MGEGAREEARLEATIALASVSTVMCGVGVILRFAMGRFV